MIISRKQKSAIVEDVMNFKKADEKLTEIVEETKKEEDLVEAVNVKPSEVLLQVELKKPEKHEGLIECADRKELAEKITELKEKKIKHKVSKQDGKYVIECFETSVKKDDVKESWEGEDIIDDIIGRAKSNISDGADTDDAVFQAIDEGLIYNKDIYALLEHYGSIDTSTIIDSYYDDLYSDVVNGLDIEESLKEDFTQKGKQMIKDARKYGLFDFYDAFAGNFTFTTQDYKANEDRVKAFLDSHEDYAVIRDSVKSYSGNDYIESSEDGFVYFVTNWGLDADEIGSAEIIVPSRHKEESLEEDKKELDLKTAIKVADDKVLDDTFGKDTPERKLAQEIKDDKSENLEEAKSSVVSKIKSKVLHYLDKLGYNEQDFNEYFVIEEKEFVNDEGDKATHIQIRNDLVDYYEAEADGLMTQLDDLVAPGYFEPYDAYVWDAYIWEDDLKEDLSEVSLDDANIDDIEVDDANVNFTVEEVEDIVDDVVDAVGEEMKTKDAEEVDIDKIKDEVISDAVELKLDELDDDVSSFDDVEIVDTPDLKLDIIDDEPIVESHQPSFSELEEWCMNNPVEMLKTIKRIRNNEMTDGDREVFNDFGFDSYSEDELKSALDKLEKETHSWIYDSGDFSEEEIKDIESQLEESVKTMKVVEESKQEKTTQEKLEEQISSDEDFSEEDAKFYENLNISNNYKNEFKSEEQQKLEEELGEVVIKDDLGVEEDMSEEDMKVFLGE